MAARKKAGSRRSKKATRKKKPAGAARKKTPARKKAAPRKAAKKKATKKKKTTKKRVAGKKTARKAAARKKTGKAAPRRKAARGTAPTEGAWALALAGDWSRGAFLAGALDALHARGVGPFPLVAGSGSGALAAALVALDRWDTLRRVFQTLEKRALVRPRYRWLPGGPAAGYLASTVTRAESLFDVREGLVRLVLDHVDIEELARSPVEVHFATVDLQSGVTHSFDNRRDPPDQLLAGLIAAASQPVLMPPVRAGYARHQHADGTLREHGPLKAIFRTLARADRDEVDVSRLLALSTDAPPGNHEAPYRGIEDVTERTVRLLTSERGVRDVQRAQLINALLGLRDAVPARTFDKALDGLAPATRTEVERHLGKRRLPIVHLHPPTPAGASVLDLDPAASRAAWDAGAAAAERWLA